MVDRMNVSYVYTSHAGGSHLSSSPPASSLQPFGVLVLVLAFSSVTLHKTRCSKTGTAVIPSVLHRQYQYTRAVYSKHVRRRARVKHSASQRRPPSHFHPSRRSGFSPVPARKRITYIYVETPVKLFLNVLLRVACRTRVPAQQQQIEW